MLGRTYRALAKRWLAAAVLALVACEPAAAALVTVQLRVEGEASTLFEGPVTTDGKTIAKDSSGPHACDGTVNGSGVAPGATVTAALEQGQLNGAYDWEGTWSATEQDFSIDRVGPDTSDATAQWAYSVNYGAAQATGGCRRQVAAGDEVIFGYGAADKANLLRLAGPQRATVGEPVTLTVTGRDGQRIAGAIVSGTPTGADGTVTFSFDTPGVRRFKAERAGDLRSGAVDVCVYVTGSGDCGTEDTTAPLARLDLPVQGRRYRTGPAELRGRVTDNKAVRQALLRLQRFDRGRCSYYDGRRDDFVGRRGCRAARFFEVGQGGSFSYLLPEELPRGDYLLEARAIDSSGNRGRASVRFMVRPRRVSGR